MSLKNILLTTFLLACNSNGNPTNYALIINGDTKGLRHKNNTNNSIDTLERLNYNITILESPSTSQELINTITILGEEIDNNDTLLIYTTGFGINQYGKQALELDNNSISLEHIVEQLKDHINAAKYIIISDQCYSGGILPHLHTLDGYTQAYTSTDGDHRTPCETFANPFWEKLAETKDFDKAFCYAADLHANDPRPTKKPSSRIAQYFNTDQGSMPYYDFCQ
ncbi:MAG: hypothetical protein Q8Q35_01585 [Nanoarchaeota archaeon]|nr:hypothetical protein [Nanoarchaeota archaeon]